jgi:hypothetical protein
MIRFMIGFHLPLARKTPNRWLCPGNPCCRRRLSTVELLIKIGCFVKKKKKYISGLKAFDLRLINTRRLNSTYPSHSGKQVSLDNRQTIS